MGNFARFFGAVVLLFGCSGPTAGDSGGDSGGDGDNSCDFVAAPTITSFLFPDTVDVGNQFDMVLNVNFDPAAEPVTARFELLAGEFSIYDQALPFSRETLDGHLVVSGRLQTFEGAEFHVIVENACSKSTRSDARAIAAATYAPSIYDSNASRTTLTRSETSDLWFAVDDRDVQYGDVVTHSYSIDPASAGQIVGDDDADPESVTFVPSPTVVGAVTVTATVTDSFGDSDSHELELTVVNQEPSVTNMAASQSLMHRAEAATVTVLAQDLDSDVLEYRYLLSGDAGGTLSVLPGQWVADNAVTFSPNPLSVGTDTVSVDVRDAFGGTVSASTQVAVYNRPPEVTTFSADSTSVGQNGTINLSTVATDPDGDALVYSYSHTGVGSISSSSSDAEVFTATSVLGSANVQVSVVDPFAAQATANLDLYVGDWSAVGAAGFSSSEGGYLNFRIDATDDMYVAYDTVIDTGGGNTGDVVVRRYNDGADTWDALGASVSSDSPLYLSMEIEGTTPVVAYTQSLGGAVVVQEWTGTSWTQRHGAAGFGYGNVVLAQDAGGLVCAYRDVNSSGSVSVREDTGTGWALTPNGTGSNVFGYDTLHMDMSVNATGDIIVAANNIDASGAWPLSAKILSGGSWQTLGQAPIYSGYADWVSLDAGASGTYLGFHAFSDGEVRILEFNATTGQWELVGNAISAWLPAQVHVQDDGSGPWVTFMESSTLTVMKYDSARDSWDHVGEPKQIGTLNGFPKLQFDSAGNAYVGYYSQVDGGVSVDILN